MDKQEAAKILKDAGEELLKRRQIKDSFYHWCCHALEPQGFTPARHHKVLIDLLQQVSEGTIKRLMVSMPPGSSKSEYCSKLFPPWWMAHHPDTRIIGASNTERLATDFSRAVRSHVMQHSTYLGFGLDESQTNVQQWASTNGGVYLAVGSEGAVLGQRASILLIDDPYKSRADAHSDVRREAIWNWYRNDLMSRLKPEGRIILVMTRFHTDDLIGRLLDTESDAWHVVKFTAICDDPENDPLGREYGELLWPEYQTAAFYEEKRRIGGEYDWACNYMQTPVPDQGSLFNTRYLLANKLTIPPDDIVQTVRAWDLAARIEGDWTCGLKLGRRQDGRFVILDVIRFRADPSKVEQTIKEVAAYDTPNTKIALSQDPGQAGTSQIQYLTRQLAGYTVLAERETGSKLVRATPVASQVNSGNVAMVEGGWNRAFLDEMANYPSSRWDDQVDALSRAFSVVAAPKTVSRYMQFDFMAR